MLELADKLYMFKVESSDVNETDEVDNEVDDAIEDEHEDDHKKAPNKS
jgi:hypothetical protein